MSRWYNRGNVHSGQGLPAEELFRLLGAREGWNVLPATDYQDRREHWDFLLSRGQEKFKVDVKSRKRISRGDSAMSDDLVWVEFKNGAGEPGWLYGQADLIAFECADCFILCNRDALLEVSLRLVDRSSPHVTSPGLALKKVYTRFQRNDEVSLLPVGELLQVGVFWNRWSKH